MQFFISRAVCETLNAASLTSERCSAEAGRLVGVTASSARRWGYSSSSSDELLFSAAFWYEMRILSYRVLCLACPHIKITSTLDLQSYITAGVIILWWNSGYFCQYHSKTWCIMTFLQESPATQEGALMSSAVVTLMRVRKADSCFLIKHNHACSEGLISAAKEHLSPIRLWELTPGCCVQFSCIFDVRLIFC